MCRHTKIWNLWYLYILTWFKSKGYFDIVYELMMWNSGMRSNNACLSKVLRWRVLCNMYSNVSEGESQHSIVEFGVVRTSYVMIFSVRDPRAFAAPSPLPCVREYACACCVACVGSVLTDASSRVSGNPLCVTARFNSTCCLPTGCTYLTLTRRPCWIDLP